MANWDGESLAHYRWNSLEHFRKQQDASQRWRGKWPIQQEGKEAQAESPVESRRSQSKIRRKIISIKMAGAKRRRTWRIGTRRETTKIKWRWWRESKGEQRTREEGQALQQWDEMSEEGYIRWQGGECKEWHREQRKQKIWQRRGSDRQGNYRHRTSEQSEHF